jgi:hypothetical protein
MKRIALLCLVFTIAMAAPAMAQINTEEKGTLRVLAFGDYYWIAANHDAEIEGNNGFWFRRIYFTYDHQLSTSFSGRLRLEMNSEGDFETSSELAPTLKDAWLQWSNENHAIKAGISSTPTWGLVEDVWGYRSVEKSPLDLYDFGSSRDFGLSFKGNLDAGDRLNYHFMFANGNSNSTELNKGKKFSLALSYNLTNHLVLQGYGDWNDNPGNSDVYTAQGFLGYESDTFNAGALYAYQLRNNATVSGDLNLDLVSLFANTRLSEKVKIFARADHLFDRNPTGPGNDYIPFSDQVESTFMTAGVDVALDKKVHLMPNVEAIVYGENETGVRPDSDLIPRLTFFFKL